MIIEVTYFSSREEREPEGIALFEHEKLSTSPEVWTEDWFIIGDFYFKCRERCEKYKDVRERLIQHDSRAHEWIGNMNDIRTVRYEYEGPKMPWYIHERNIANLIFQELCPDGHKLKGEIVGTLTKL